MMCDEYDSRSTVVMPQRRAGKRFEEMTSKRNVKRISLERANGDRLVDLPMQVDVKNAVPRAFRLPMQAGVTAVSVLARIFRLKIVFQLEEDEL